MLYVNSVQCAQQSLMGSLKLFPPEWRPETITTATTDEVRTGRGALGMRNGVGRTCWLLLVSGALGELHQ